MPGDDTKRQLPQLRFAEQPSVGLDRQQEAVLAQQCPGERVIGADRCRVVGGVDAAGNDARARKPGQPGADAAQQLSCGLAGERQAENLARRGVAVGDQPHHPGRHRLGLARARARNHHQRPRRCGDDRRLLVGRREQAKGGGQLGGPVFRCHDVAVPSVAAWAGQLCRIGQCAQPSLMRARNCGPWVAAAALPHQLAPLAAAIRRQRILLAARSAPAAPACRGRPAALRPGDSPSGSKPSAIAS